MSVYVRKSGMHMCGGKCRPCFDVASVEVYEDFQRQGLFTRWLDYVEKVAPEYGCEVVFVEAILNPMLSSYLGGRGYLTADNDESSMYKRVK